jgi:transcriptional regulator with XRE-family HTH domain
MQMTDVTSVLGRLAQVLGTRTGNQLADALGVSPQTISSWKSRESVPYAQCVSIAEEWSVSLDWLLTGIGPMYRGESASSGHGSTDNPREQALLALWRELDEDAQREIQRSAQEKKRLSDIEAQLKELAAAVAALNRTA